MENDDIFDGLGVEITLKTKEDFLKVKETLTRIGISSRTDKKYKEPMIPLSKLKIISHKDKGDWQLIPKYHIGRK